MSDTVIVAAGLVRYLRKGLRSELGCAAHRIEIFMLEFEDAPADKYQQSFKILVAAHALLCQIEPTSDAPQTDIELDLSSNSNAGLVLKALKRQHNVEVIRLQEAELYGPIRDATREETQALRDLVRVVKRYVQRRGGHQAEHLPTQSCGTRTHAPRRNCDP